MNELARRGQEAVTVDLPCDDDSCGLSDYVGAAVEAIGDRRNLIVVAHSLGAITGVLLCDGRRSTSSCWCRRPAAEFQRRVVRKRLGFTPDEMGGGHLPMLANPVDLVDRLESYRSGG